MTTVESRSPRRRASEASARFRWRRIARNDVGVIAIGTFERTDVETGLTARHPRNRHQVFENITTNTKNRVDAHH